MSKRAKPTLFLPGAAIGAVLAYLLDPVSGRHRLARLASRLGTALRRLTRTAADRARTARHTRRLPPTPAREPAIAGVTDVATPAVADQATEPHL